MVGNGSVKIMLSQTSKWGGPALKIFTKLSFVQNKAKHWGIGGGRLCCANLLNEVGQPLKYL